MQIQGFFFFCIEVTVASHGSRLSKKRAKDENWKNKKSSEDVIGESEESWKYIATDPKGKGIQVLTANNPTSRCKCLRFFFLKIF